VARSYFDKVDVTPCFAVVDGGKSWIVRCRFCSAGCIPAKDDRAGGVDLIAFLQYHARRVHKIRLSRIPPPAALHKGTQPPYIRGMPINVPADAKVIRHSNLTLIRVICTLHDKLVEGEHGLKAKAKRSLIEKDADFAESDLVVAALRAGSAKATIDPRKLYTLVEAGELTMSQFLDCVTVAKKPLERHLGSDTIDGLSTMGPAPQPSLVTEFKAGVEPNLERLAEQLLGGLASLLPTKAA
jgi:hypothetical protein